MIHAILKHRLRSSRHGFKDYINQASNIKAKPMYNRKPKNQQNIRIWHCKTDSQRITNTVTTFKVLKDLLDGTGTETLSLILHFSNLVL